MPYDPQQTKYPYTERTDQHYLVVKKDNGTVFDENYPYVDYSKKAKVTGFFVNLVLYVLMLPFCRLWYGIRIKGRKNLKTYKNELANGAITVSNHVHLFDYIFIKTTLRKKNARVLVWKRNVSGENGKLIRGVGGIPIPDNDFKATMAFFDKTKEFASAPKTWLQIYAEGSMWEYYQPIRPFKEGAAYFAIKANKPVIPIAFSYRKSSWFRKNIMRVPACFNIAIGEPLFANKELKAKQAEEDLTIRLHDSVCRLAGIDPDKNLYPPVFKNNKRIDYYTTQYGVKKKAK